MTYRPWEITTTQRNMIIADALEGCELPQEYISSAYRDWVRSDDYSILKNKESSEVYAALQVKRGNRSYAIKHQKKLQNILCRFHESVNSDSFSFTDPDDPTVGGSCVLFMTLNFNPDELSKTQSWLRVKNLKGEDGEQRTASAGHLFTANLQKLFKNYWKEIGAAKEFQAAHIVSQSNIESHASGYPHIHITIILDRCLPVVLHESRKFKGLYTWRLADLKLLNSIKALWSRCVNPDYPSPRSFCDIQAAVGDRVLDHEGNYTSALAYCLKYSTKTVDIRKEKDVLTHAYLKFFNTRSIVGKRFLERIAAAYGKDTRHDELTNELQRARQRYREINATIRELWSLQENFMPYSNEPEYVSLQWEAVQTALYIEYLEAELEQMRHWRYLGTVSFRPDEDQTGFWEAVRQANSATAIRENDVSAIFSRKME